MNNEFVDNNEIVERSVPANIEVRSGMSGVVQAENASLSSAGAGIVTAGEDLKLQSGGASAIVAGHDIDMQSGGGAVLIAGGNMNLREGGGMVLVSGGNLSIEEGGGAVLAAATATLKRSTVGLLIAGDAHFGEGSRVIMTATQAAALGAALGLTFAIANRLLRGLRNS